MEHAVQKAKREVEAKANEKAKKQRLLEKEKKKKQLEYLQQLQDKVLAEDIALLEDVEGSQVVRSKYKEVTFRDEEGQWPSKKARGKQPGKYCKGAAVKMGGANPCERYVCTRQDCLVYHSR